MSVFLIYVKPQRKSKVWEEGKIELEGRDRTLDTQVWESLKMWLISDKVSYTMWVRSRCNRSHIYLYIREMATHSSILTWKIPWTEEPGGLQSVGSQESDMT